MASIDPRAPIQPGERAPDFKLPSVDQEGSVTLSDYLGKSPVLLAINRGLWCPFCRRHIAHLGTVRDKLHALGVETLAIVATRAERARLYFRFHPARVRLAADAELLTHRAYGLPQPEFTPELIQAAQSVNVNPTGELPQAVSVAELNQVFNDLDRFEPTDTDLDDQRRQYAGGPQLTGQFLVDQTGIVRWANVECAKEGLAGAGKFPTDEELLAAARALPG